MQQLLVNNKTISDFIIFFLSIIGPFYMSLNARELVFLQNSFLFNNIYKSIFGTKKNLDKKS